VNRVVVALFAGFVVVVGIAGLVYYAARPERIDPATPIASPLPALAPPAARNSPAPSVPAPTPAAAARAPVESAPKPAAPPTTGTLILESDTPDTTIFIDRKFLGTAPQTLTDVTPGQHQLIFSPTGQDSIRMTVDVEPGTRTVTARFREVQLDEKVEVVHKHAFGSCRGTLKATPQGLAYETKNTDDAFSVPLTNPEVFTVDFLEKNLKVKLKGGKTYNFESVGPADTLYAFQQAVEKVRQRLLAGRRP